jgi:23S rRNA pseudouridine2605 synthase
VAEGVVRVNGRVVAAQGVRVDPATDQVTVRGQRVVPETGVYILMNKPAGVLCTSRDPQGRRILADLLPPGSPRLFSVGRLDRDSEGLLILTNDGELAHRLAHPRHQISKVYHVWVNGVLSRQQESQMRQGVKFGDEVLHLARLRLAKPGRANTACYEVVLEEGRKRQIRRMFEAVGFHVERLRRVGVGPLRLGDLRVGEWRRLTPAEVNHLHEEGSHSARVA